MVSLSLHLPCLCFSIPSFRGAYVLPLRFLRYVTSGFGSLPCSECSCVLVAALWFPYSCAGEKPAIWKWKVPDFVPSLTYARGLASSAPAVSGSVLVLPGWAHSRERQFPSLASVHSKSPLHIFIVIYTFLRSGLWTRIFFKTTMKRESWKNSQRIFFFFPMQQARIWRQAQIPAGQLHGRPCAGDSLLAEWLPCAGPAVSDQPGQVHRSPWEVQDGSVCIHIDNLFCASHASTWPKPYPGLIATGQIKLT